MSANDPIVDVFYGLAEVAEGIDDDKVALWLGALTLLLAEEIDDPQRVVTLAAQAAESTRG